MSRYASDRAFEDEVRRTADAVFQLPCGACLPATYSSGKRTVEVDGVARQVLLVHLIMATTSSKLSKVKEDVNRLLLAAEVEEKRHNLAKMWIIVEKQAEGPHITYAQAQKVELLTLQQFRSRFFNGRDYLAKRDQAAFGSARDIETGSPKIASDEYVEPPMTDVESGARMTLKAIVSQILAGRVVILIGPFGCGKSLTLREVWFRLRDLYLSGNVGSVPVAINLREHWGAQYADEILQRHARSLGFEPEAALITAWRGGMALLLVDGFDEMAAQGIVTLESVHVLRRIRQEALVGVKNLLAMTAESAGALITGRDHYFDDRPEMSYALGVGARSPICVRIEEFDEPQARLYLRKKGYEGELPGWLPRKALFLGYLARHDLLTEVLAIDGNAGQARAWAEFLGLVCKREADHDRAVMDPETVQRVLEFLSIRVRSTLSGHGPIPASMLAQAYVEVSGQAPGDAVLMQLQRLPGLTERDAEPGTRTFVEEEFLEALQGAAIARFLVEGHASGRVSTRKQTRFSEPRLDDTRWLEPLGPVGCAVAALELRDQKWSLEGVCEAARIRPSSQLGGDLVQIALDWASEEGAPLDVGSLELTGARLRRLDLDEHPVQGLRLKDCIVDEVVIGRFASASSLDLSATVVRVMGGIAARAAVPAGITLHEDVEVEKFEQMATTDSLIALELDSRTRALLTVLKKLFRQRGAGRVIGAFHRGVPHDVDLHVEGVIRLLESEGMVWRHRDVCHPVRREARRANAILDAPFTCEDHLLEQARRLR